MAGTVHSRNPNSRALHLENQVSPFPLQNHPVEKLLPESPILALAIRPVAIAQMQ